VSNACPDRQMLSVYLDGELPSPWKEKLESHVSGCPECAGRIKAYRNIALIPGGGAATGEEIAVNAAGERVWQRLDASMKRGRMFPRSRAIWRRSVSLPVPVAAALLVVALTFAWMQWTPDADEMVGVSFTSETELDVPVQDMESVIEYLIARSGSEMLILRLPETQSFVSNGEPAIIRAADYSRQLASWNMQGRRRN